MNMYFKDKYFKSSMYMYDLIILMMYKAYLVYPIVDVLGLGQDWVRVSTIQGKRGLGVHGSPQLL